MTIIEYQERLNENQDKIIKTQANIEKRLAKVEKTRKAYELDQSRSNSFDYEIAKDDLKTAERKLKDLQFVANNWQERLNKEIAKQNMIDNNTPEILKYLHHRGIPLNIITKLSFIEMSRLLKYHIFLLGV